MQLPKLQEIRTSKDIVDTFYGYNHNLKIGRGEFYDEKNMTSAFYPILSPRNQRGTYANANKPLGMISKDNLCYVDGSVFVFDKYRIEMQLNDEPKTLVSMGAYVIILPDKKYINTADTNDRGDIEVSVSTSGNVSVELSLEDGNAMTVTYTQPAAPANPKNLEYWMDTSSTPHSLKQWSETSAMWVSVPTTYVRISAAGIGVQFNQYDGIEISGFAQHEDYDLSNLNGSTTIWSKGDNWIVITGIIEAARTVTDQLTLKREMPLMDFVIESGNRLWGCRYGLSSNGEVVNEIYASKLGDFRNWSSYMGTSMDSWRASCGSDGQWTGAIALGGHPLFFKENRLHKCYGTQPSNFQIQDIACRGVQKGSSKSLAIVNEVLYYKSRLGVCAYDGSLPGEISAAMGDQAYFDAVGGGHGNNYYISMADETGQYHMFTYDTLRRIWHREDNTKAEQFCSSRNEMYYIEGNAIKTIFGSGTRDAEPVEWMVESGVIGTETPSGRGTSRLVGKKYVSRLIVRLSMAAGAKVKAYIRYDSTGDWEQAMAVESSTLRTYSLPIRPKRCDHFHLRFAGEGECKIYSICKELEQGSDL